MKEINHIYNEDCMIGMADIPPKSVDLVLTDIPYGEVNRKSNGLRNLDKANADTFDIDLEVLVKTMASKTKGSMYVFCGTKQVSDIIRYMQECGMSTRIGIWKKTNPSPMNGDSIWLSGIEVCAYGKFPKATFNEHCKNSVWEYHSGRSKLHPTQKPTPLFEYLIKTSSNEGDIVLDPFMGSGTTAVAAKLNNRRFIGFELDSEFCKIANNRVQEI